MLGRPLLFLSSYAPLFGLLAIRFESRWLWITCTALAAAGVFSLWLLLKLGRRPKLGKDPYTLASVRDAGAEAAAYLSSYLLPFLTVGTPSIRDVLAYAGFLVIAALIYIRSSMIQANPLLYLLGYKVLSVTDSNQAHAYVITRHTLRSGENLIASRLRDDVLMDRG